MRQFEGTTILSDRRGENVVIGGDGQVSLGDTVMKANARKVRRLFNQQILAGFAGATADAFTLFERFEAKLQKHQGNLMRSAVELAKDWRTDRMLRRLEAMLCVADKAASLIISGNGDVIEPADDIMAIGLRRSFCPGGRPGAAGKYRSRCAPDCRKGPRYRGRYLHLHERQSNHRRNYRPSVQARAGITSNHT